MKSEHLNLLGIGSTEWYSNTSFCRHIWDVSLYIFYPPQKKKEKEKSYLGVSHCGLISANFCSLRQTVCLSHYVFAFDFHMPQFPSKLLILGYIITAEAAKRTAKKPRDSTSLNQDHGNLCFFSSLTWVTIIKGINQISSLTLKLSKTGRQRRIMRSCIWVKSARGSLKPSYIDCGYNSRTAKIRESQRRKGRRWSFSPKHRIPPSSLPFCLLVEL